MNNIDRLKRDIVTECKEDFVGIWIVIQALENQFPEETANWIHKTTLAVVKEILEENEWVNFVSLENEQFVRWDMQVHNIVARISEEWKALGRDPRVPEIGWLSQWPI